ncbi:MAG: hypothetical protein ACKOGA_22560, partial [Planctomycetaceae bacterium]
MNAPSAQPHEVFGPGSHQPPAPPGWNWPQPAWAHVALFTLAVGQRLLWLLTTHAGVHSTGEGPRAVDSLLQRGVLGEIFPGVPGPSAHLAPLWPALVAGLSRVTGLHPERAGQLASLTAVGLTATLLPVLARRLGWPARVGWVAGLALALCPLYTHSELFDCVTQPATGLTLLALAAAIPWQRGRGGLRWSEVVGWGLALGAAAWLEPFVPLTAGLVVALVLLREISPRSLGQGVCLGLIAGLVVAPWLVRNRIQLGGWVPIRGNFGLEFALGNQPGAMGTAVRSAAADLHPFTSPAAAQRVVELGELSYVREVGGNAWQWAVNHPLDFGQLCLRRARLYWFPPPRLLGSGRRSAWPRALLLWSGTLAVGWQLYRGLRERPQLWAGLALFCLVP